MDFHELNMSFIGDSLSLPGRTPGNIFCEWAAQAGATVNKQAVGGFAISYWRPGLKKNKFGIRAAELSQVAMSSNPQIVYALLGMNDYLQGPRNVGDGIRALQLSLGGRLFLLGPPQVGASVRGGSVRDGLQVVCNVAKEELKERFFDSRPLSEDLTSAKDRPDGIHFSRGAAEAFGGRLFHAVREGRSPQTVKRSGNNDLLLYAAGTYGVVKVIQYAVRKGWI